MQGTAKRGSTSIDKIKLSVQLYARAVHLSCGIVVDVNGGHI